MESIFALTKALGNNNVAGVVKLLKDGTNITYIIYIKIKTSFCPAVPVCKSVNGAE